MKVQIFLRNGGIIKVMLDKFTIHRSPVTGQIGSIEWTNAGKTSGGYGCELSYIDPAEIAAIVRMQI